MTSATLVAKVEAVVYNLLILGGGLVLAAIVLYEDFTGR